MYQAQHKVISHRWTLNKVKSFLVYIRFSFLTNVLLSATGNLLRLLGNNPVQAEGETSNLPHWPVHWHAYSTGPTATGQISAGQINFVAVPTISSTPTQPKPIQCTLRRPQATATIYYLMSFISSATIIEFPTFKSIFFVVFATSFRVPSVRLVTSPYMRLRRPRGSLQGCQNLIQGTVTGHRSRLTLLSLASFIDNYN